MASASTNFSQLFRSSRLAAVPKPLQYPQATNYVHPTHQVIHSTPASRHRQDWGLKSSIPRKVATSHIVVQALDTPLHMPIFSGGGKFLRVRERFRETRAPIGRFDVSLSEEFGALGTQSSGRDLANALFPAEEGGVARRSLKDMSAAEKAALLASIGGQRANFRKYIEEVLHRDYAEVKKNSQDLVDAAFDFLQLSRTGGKSRRVVQGTGGLGYALRNAVANTPNGFEYRTKVPGRILNQITPKNYAVAIGGIVAKGTIPRVEQIQRANPGRALRESVHQFVVDSVVVDKTGEVVMAVKREVPDDDHKSPLRRFGDTRQSPFDLTALGAPTRRGSGRQNNVYESMISALDRQAAPAPAGRVKGLSLYDFND
ncbi:mitochondrial 37S ribosomal protein bS1m [Dipodascopsis tothii]|uniref:mitochondrial 37S ribosomal protein bS1m n=1 Tax=Dipodascopsis tothii TaxID=44089 RepID=UPI0034CD6681